MYLYTYILVYLYTYIPIYLYTYILLYLYTYILLYLYTFILIDIIDIQYDLCTTSYCVNMEMRLKTYSFKHHSNLSSTGALSCLGHRAQSCLPAIPILPLTL